MRQTQILVFSLFLSILAAFTPVQAQSLDSDEPLVRVRLLPESDVVQPGEEIWLAVEQVIRPEWHTYWVNPGDSGAEPRIKWSLPEGFEVSDIYWPTPEKLPYGPLLNYGYSERVTLLQKLKAPDVLPQGGFEISGNFEILVCKDECIPEFGTIDAAFNAPGIVASDNAPFITVALNKLPRDMRESEDWTVSYTEEGDDFVLKVDGINITENSLESVEFFPVDWGMIDNIAEPSASLDGDVLVIKQKRGDRSFSDVKDITGVVTFTAEDGVREAFHVAAAQKMPLMQKVKDSVMPEAANSAVERSDDISFLQALLFALLGGLILNLMPCVFPVLSMKAISLVKIAEKHPEIARKHGLSYTAGVVISFLVIAGALLIFKAFGYSAGWGFQLQNPVVIAILSYILFLVGLNLAGYFDLGNNFGGIGQKLTQGDGYKNSFFTGILATLVATPCTAPFMAASVGFALTQSAIVSLSVFAALGFGLALPYLVLSHAPALQSKLPKPGPWMEHFKHFLAFPMFGAAIWLVWVLSQQAGPMGVLGVLIGMLGFGFGIWLLKVMPEKGLVRIFTKILVVLAFLTPVAFLPAGAVNVEKVEIKEEMGEVYSEAMLNEAKAGDDPIFVEMTAAWCITCKVNHATSISVPSTMALFKKHNVKYMVGDWTNYDPRITEFLNRYGRNGVPIYVYYGPRDPETGLRPDAEILPQILTPGVIRSYIEKPV